MFALFGLPGLSKRAFTKSKSSSVLMPGLAKAARLCSLQPSSVYQFAIAMIRLSCGQLQTPRCRGLVRQPAVCELLRSTIPQVIRGGFANRPYGAVGNWRSCASISYRQETWKEKPDIVFLS
jgi:hypothetical protein